MANMTDAPQPAVICAALLGALEAAEGRRRSRKRDQTPDAIGLAVKRDLLQRVVRDDPNPEEFEGWLLSCAESCAAADSAGAVAAMARAIFEEWKLARSMTEFKNWLDNGTPSDDTDTAKEKSSSHSEQRASILQESVCRIGKES